LFVRVTPLHVSLAIGLPNDTPVAKQEPASALTVNAEGHVSEGGCESSTVTVKVQMLVLPLESVAVLVTVVTPGGNVLPLAGTLTKLATLPQLSFAVTLKVTLLRVQPLASAANTRFVGHAMTGATLSWIVTVKVQLAVLPLASVAMN
jgi:hypothetical protein